MPDLRKYILKSTIQIDVSEQICSVGQNSHFHDWWRNSYTYGPGPGFVLGNEAHEPLERAKTRRLPIFKTLPSGTHQELLLDQVSRKRDSWWSMTYPMGSSETTYLFLFIHI